MSEQRANEPRDDGYSYTPERGYDPSTVRLQTGDTKDDDPQAFEDYVTTNNGLYLTPAKLPLEQSQKLDPPKPITKLKGNTVTISPGVPVLLLPADPNRQEVQVTMTSNGSANTGTDVCTISSESVVSMSLAGTILNSQNWSSARHTGAIWVTFIPWAGDGLTPASNSTSCLVNVTAVSY